MPSKTFILILALLLSLNGPTNSLPSVTLTNADSQSWAMVFGSPTADATKAARVDVTLTSQYLFKTQFLNVGAICAVTDTSGALSVADYNSFSINFQCKLTNLCADTSSQFIMYMSFGILHSTGSVYDFIHPSGITLTPVLDYSMTGTGTSGDPYVWSLGYEFSSAQVTTFFVPTSSQFLTCWAGPDTRINAPVFQDVLDLGNNANFVSNIPVTTPTPSNSPANIKSDSYNFNIVKQGLVMVVIFISQQIE